MKSTEMEFWDNRYRAGKTPWDFGGIPSALAAYFNDFPAARVDSRLWIGMEVRAFHERGWMCWLWIIRRLPSNARDRCWALSPQSHARRFLRTTGGSKFDVIYGARFCARCPGLATIRAAHGGFARQRRQVDRVVPVR